MIEASCHCGAVTLHIDAEPPAAVTDCNCSICRRYGVRWAYYSPKQVRLTGRTDSYSWGEKSLEFHRCAVCGCVTHWSAVDRTKDRMGVNVRLAPPEVLAQTRIRRLDGADTWTYFDD